MCLSYEITSIFLRFFRIYFESIYLSNYNNFNPTTYVGGGGLFGPDHQVIDHNRKIAQPGTFKLAEF